MRNMCACTCTCRRERARSGIDGIDELRRNAADARFGNGSITSVRSSASPPPLARMSSSESSSEYSCESAEETLEGVYVHLLICIGQIDGLGTDIDWADAFRWNDAKRDAAALALFALTTRVMTDFGQLKRGPSAASPSSSSPNLRGLTVEVANADANPSLNPGGSRHPPAVHAVWDARLCLSLADHAILAAHARGSRAFDPR